METDMHAFCLRLKCKINDLAVNHTQLIINTPKIQFVTVATPKLDMAQTHNDIL